MIKAKILSFLILLSLCTNAHALSCVQIDSVDSASHFFKGIFTDKEQVSVDANGQNREIEYTVEVTSVWHGDIAVGDEVTFIQNHWVGNGHEVGSKGNFALDSITPPSEIGVCGSPFFMPMDENANLREAFTKRMDALRQ